MSFGTQHKQTAYLKCGSKMKRIISWSTYLDAGNKRDRSMVIDITYMLDFWSGI
jgi:hypothetical protein